MEEIKSRLKELKMRLQKVAQTFDKEKMRQEIREQEAETMKPGFWDDQRGASKISQELADKQKQLETLENLEKRIDDSIELSDDVAMLDDLETEANQIEMLLKDFELKTFLSGPYD